MNGPTPLRTLDPTTTDEQVLADKFIEFMQMLATQRGEPKENHLWGSHEQLLLSMVKTPTVLSEVTLPPEVSPGQVKECFYNAYMLAATHPTLHYTEGFAMTAGFFPVNHAWCTDTTTGAIVDPTWANLSTAGSVVYMGLAFTMEFMRNAVVEPTDVPAVFESDWRRRWKVLRLGLVFDKDGAVCDWGDPPPF